MRDLHWTYNRQSRHWALRADSWRAHVARTDTGDAWIAWITRADQLDWRVDSPTFDWADDARAWCVTELARLKAGDARSE